MKMEDRLPGVGARVRDKTIPSLSDSFFLREFPRDGEEMPDQRLVFRFERVYRLDVLVRHDQNMRRSHRVQIAKGSRLFIAENNGRFCFFGNTCVERSRNDLTENA